MLHPGTRRYVTRRYELVCYLYPRNEEGKETQGNLELEHDTLSFHFGKSCVADGVGIDAILVKVSS